MELKLDWSKESVHTDGRFVSTASPTQEFWTVWREKKAAIKAAGYSVRKVDNKWVVTRYRDNDQAIADSQATDADIDIPVPAGLSYLPYQKAGIAYAIKRSATLIGDEMGLGKTIQAIGVINATAPKTVLVVCPASLKINWKNEMTKWLVADRDIQIVNGGGEQIPANPDVIIINYDVLSKHKDAINARTWDLVIMDEAHYIKNNTAARTKVAVGIKANRKVVLTGTPITNRPIELQPIAGYLDPVTFGNYFKFGVRYAGAHQINIGRKTVWDFNGSSNLDELQRVLRQSFMIRRKKDEVLKELPEKVRQIIVLPNSDYSDQIKKEFETLADAVDETSSEDIEFEQMSGVRHETALAKVNDVVTHVAAIDHQVVVMAHHKDVVDGIKAGLEAAGKSVVTLTGDCNQAHRQNAVETFQAGNADVFIGTIGAAGVGITLTSASHVVFAELDWVPGNMSQAEDRCHRIGQDSSVLVQHLVVDGSIDARLAQVLVGKQRVLDKALDNVVVNNISIEDIALDVETVEKTFKAKNKKSPKPLPKAVVSSLQDFVASVASSCDGAFEEDGSGFNKMDSGLGNSLARQDEWTPAQQHAARTMVKKYKRQIVASGLGQKYDKVYNS
jgi:SWI/SNF-related matrix-associated actin-dependent regulator 1 of chromatin subfamily A